MARQIIISPQADSDIDECVFYLVDEAGMDVAIRFYDLVFKTLEKITQMPGAGSLKRLQNERFHELRQWVLPEFDNYIIFYDESDDKIDVIRVLHGARDIDRILNDET